MLHLNLCQVCGCIRYTVQVTHDSVTRILCVEYSDQNTLQRNRDQRKGKQLSFAPIHFLLSQDKYVNLGKTSKLKTRFLSGIARKGGGGLPMPEFCWHFFHQVKVPIKLVHYYSKLMICVCFLSSLSSKLPSLLS